MEWSQMVSYVVFGKLIFFVKPRFLLNKYLYSKYIHIYNCSDLSQRFIFLESILKISHQIFCFIDLLFFLWFLSVKTIS